MNLQNNAYRVEIDNLIYLNSLKLHYFTCSWWFNADPNPRGKTSNVLKNLRVNFGNDFKN